MNVAICKKVLIAVQKRLTQGIEGQRLRVQNIIFMISQINAVRTIYGDTLNIT